MEALFNNLSGILFITFIFGGWVITAVVSTIATNWRKARESEHLAVLKQNMIDRGMSAEEIERIVRAGPHSCAEEGKLEDSAKNVKRG